MLPIGRTSATYHSPAPRRRSVETRPVNGSEYSISLTALARVCSHISATAAATSMALSRQWSHSALSSRQVQAVGWSIPRSWCRRTTPAATFAIISAVTPDFANAVHIAHGDSAAATLRQLGARTVWVRRDLLTVGPCDADPIRHRALRRQFWGGDPDTPSGLPGVDADDELQRALAGAGGAPVVIWASRAWSDLPFLWSVVDALARLGAERPWLARPTGDDATVSVGGIEPARVRSALDVVEPLGEEVARSCVNFWQAYTAPSPLPFDELRRRGARVVPELGRILEGHAAWFPWRRDGGIALSDADAAIFHWADDGALDHCRHLLHWIGDRSLFARVAAWRALGRLDGDDRAPRLTEAGRRLRDEGAPSVADLPPWWIGGCRVNDPATPWLRVATGGDWKIASG